MAVPTVLTDQSVGAPSLTGEDGSLYGVLKWALPQLGWTLEFDDPVNFRAAFRNNPVNGSGYYLRIVDKSADHAGAANVAAVAAYSAMTNVNSGTLEFPLSERYWAKSAALSATAQKYYIVGTNKFFWFARASHLLTNTTYGYQFVFAGDYESLSATDAHSFVLGSTDESAPNVNGECNAFSNASKTPVAACTITSCGNSIDGTTKSINMFALTMANLTSSSTQMFGAVGLYPNPHTGGLTVSPIYLTEGNSFDNAIVRGILPGFCNTIERIVPIAQSDFTVGDLVPVKTPGGVSSAIFLPFSSRLESNSTSNSLYGAILLDAQSDWSTWT